MKKSKGFAPFEDYSARLDEAIKQLFAEFTRQLPEVSEHADWALEYVKTYSLQSGKRTRGSLAAAAYDHAKGTLFSQVGLRLGAAIEMIQNHLLIIDEWLIAPTCGAANRPCTASISGTMVRASARRIWRRF